MTYNTGNPIGSTDARDRSDNSENLDLAVNSLSQTFVDRLGVTRDTLEGIYQKSAYYRAGTFDAGYTLTNNRQTLAYGNVEYSWSGAFPKVVAAGSTPATSGGIGAGAWVDRTDVTLRSDINIIVKRFACVADMIADTALSIGQIVETIGYYDGWVATATKPKGGNRYEIVAAGTGTNDGGSFITLSNGLQAKGLFPCGKDVCQFGAKGDGVTDDTLAIQNALNNFDAIYIPPGLYVTSSPLTFSGNTEIVGQAFVGNQGFGHWGTDVTAKECIEKQITIIGNITSDVLVGTGRINITNVGFTGVLGPVAISSTKCITKAATGSMAVNLRGCAFTAFNTAIDNNQTSYSQYITECVFFLNGTGVSLTNDPFNVIITKSKFTENNVGVDLGPGDSVKITDNNFAITALKNQIGIRSTACTNVDFSRNYFEDYGTVPASDHGAYAYWIIFNGFQTPPDTITLENNIIQMGGNSDSAIRLSQNNKRVRLPLDTKFNKNTYLSCRVSDIFVESDANIAIDLRDLSVTNRPVFHANDYFCQFDAEGNLVKGYGLTCTKLSNGQFRVRRDSFTAQSPTLLATVSPLSISPVFASVQAIQSEYVDILLLNSNLGYTSVPFIVNVKEI